MFYAGHLVRLKYEIYCDFFCWNSNYVVINVEKSDIYDESRF